MINNFINIWIFLYDRYKYNNTKVELISTLELHLKACRDVEFNENGTILFSTAKDLCMMLTDLETEKLIRLYENIHEYVY